MAAIARKKKLIETTLVPTSGGRDGYRFKLIVTGTDNDIQRVMDDTYERCGGLDAARWATDGYNSFSFRDEADAVLIQKTWTGQPSKR